MALMRNIYPMVHIVDLGSFNDNGSSFELDILPAKYFYRGLFIPVRAKSSLRLVVPVECRRRPVYPYCKSVYL